MIKCFTHQAEDSRCPRGDVSAAPAEELIFII